MPYREYTAEPVRRFDTTEAFDAAFNNHQNSKLRQNRLRYADEEANIIGKNYAVNRFGQFFEKNLGFAIGQDGTVPKDANGATRMFIVKKDQNGLEQILDYDGHKLSDGTPLEMNSFEFFDQMQMGNVFAYPLGDEDPVQLQMHHLTGEVRFSCSKPVTREDIVNTMEPEPEIPPQPGTFRRLMHSWFGWYKADFDEIANKTQEHDDWVKRRDDLGQKLAIRSTGRKLGRVSEEKETARLKKEAEAKAAELEKANVKKQAIKGKLDIAISLAGHTDLGQKLSHAIYEPVPKIIETEETKKLFPGRTVKEDGVHERLHQGAYTDEDGIAHEAGGFFNKDTFSKMTVIPKEQLDLSSIKVGETGKSVTTGQFCDLALFAGMNPKFGVEAYKVGPNCDPTLRPAMQKVTTTVGGKTERVFSDEQIDKMIAGSISSMYTTDTYKTTPRDASGGYAETGIDPARKLTAEALNDYKAGKPEKLAEIIADGVNQQAGNLCQVENGLGEENMGGITASKTLVDMLQADPKLKEAAFKAGMQEKNLWMVEGVQQIGLLHQQAADAQVKLLQAAYDGRELPPEEKAAAVKSIVKANVAIQSLNLENTNMKAPDIDRQLPKLIGGGMSPKDKTNPLKFNFYNEKGELIMPPEGTCYLESGYHMAEQMKRFYRDKPTSVMLLKTPSGQKNLDIVADKIVAEDKLLSLSTEELTKQLPFEPNHEHTQYGQRGLAIMAKEGLVTMDTINELKQEMKTGVAAPKKEEAKPEVKQEEPQVQAGNNIKNRAQMFEPKQTSGPVA